MCLAVPGRIVSILGEDPIIRSGRVDFGGVVKEINLAYAPEARVGDYVLVHVGFAMTVIDEAEAQRIYAELLSLAGALPQLAGAETEVARTGVAV
jgi:hydrogenase expression/formation protein HypC